ncbi:MULTISPECIES: hypothetical protein [Bacteroidales]|uniref:Uncharacterized protein n=1 Tax=Parabacteroides distasonis TaxID=823 RepID=A0A3L7ZRH6_PARDI|nr:MULTISPECIES: hypothetical protein [Bacteroidales]NBH89288.1 hypothetical protein [Parabacteroides distasonis]RLT69838.1 hypothetical protein D7V92_09475 [Parabacteroides sp. CH2-D42-20]RLT74474.1 hypothetical protein D7V78_05015 [Parabacteroides distasonis]
MGLLNYTTAKINELLAKVAALPAKVMDGDTKIPSKTSDLENDSKFVKETGLKTVNGHSLLGTGDLTISGGSGGGVADSVDWSKVLNKPGWVNSQTKPSYTASEVGALPSDTAIPSKTSQLTNDSKFVKETGLKTINGQSLLGTGNISISGGSGEGSGGGNVNVMNAAELKAVRNYVFKPSNDGSTDGTFSALNIATLNESGLMSTQQVKKLYDIKDVYKFPAAVLGLTSASTSDEILAAFGLDPIQENGNLAYIIYLLSSGQSADYNEEFPSLFIGNYACYVYATMGSSTGEMELSYIGQGGVLKTVKVTCKDAADDKFTYSVCFYESGGEEFYLPSSIFDLTKTSTKEEVAAVFNPLGGLDHIIELAKKTTTKFYIVDASTGTGNNRSCVNLGGHIAASVLRYINISYVDKFLVSHYIQISGIKTAYLVSDKKDINLKSAINYETVSPEVYALTSQSTSEEIRSAFFSLSEFKRYIEAAKKGYILRTSIPESMGLDYKNPIYLNTLIAHVTNDGDAILEYIIAGPGINGYAGMQIVFISYTASSDSFSISVLPFSTGS